MSNGYHLTAAKLLEENGYIKEAIACWKDTPAHEIPQGKIAELEAKLKQKRA